MVLSGYFVLITGSASTEASSEHLAHAADYVRRAVRAILSNGGGVVVFTGAPEPQSASGHPLIFDWLVLEEVDRESVSGVARVVAVTSAKARSRMSPERAALLDRLVERGVVRLVAVPDDVHTGGNISDMQVEHAHAMIAVGGGKGVADRAMKMMRKRGIVVPLEARIGSASDDGSGSASLHQQAIAAPERFVPHAPEALRDTLPLLSVHGSSLDLVVEHTVTVLARERAARDAARPPDVVLLTALPVELDASQRALGIVTDAQKTTHGTNVWMADVLSRRSARSLRIAVACLGAAGNTGAAATAGELARAYRPRLVLMVGIAAGMRGQCLIGDVVFSERVAAYEPAALVERRGLCAFLGRKLGLARTSDQQRRPELYRLAHAIEQDVVAYVASPDATAERLRGALTVMNVSRSASDDVTREVRPRLSTIASGEKLLRDPSVLAGLRYNIHGKIEVVEMEAAGIAEACRRHQTDFLIIRGISDYGDSKKTNDAHRLASAGAAAVAADFLREGLVLT